MNPPKDTLPFPGKAILWFFLNDDDYYQSIKAALANPVDSLRYE